MSFPKKFMIPAMSFAFLLFSAATYAREPDQLTVRNNAFVRLSDIDPSIVQEMRYAGDHNFLGRPLPGYPDKDAQCILTREAAQALAAVQKELKIYSLSLKVYDCYRPQKAVGEFVKWTKDLHDLKMRKEFYPKVEKNRLFKDGYIAEKSGHSRGSTVDLTLIPDPAPKQASYRDGDPLVECFFSYTERFHDNSLDMGTGFDCFDPLSHTASPGIGDIQKRNRLLLKSMMEKNGFRNHTAEWWHFTLKKEPFPKRYFDFDAK